VGRRADGVWPGPWMSRLVGPAAAVLAAVLTAVPIALDGWPTDVRGQVGAWCMVGGAALVALAASDRAWRSISLALAGAPLVWRGATGSWPTIPQAVVDRLPEQLS